VGVRDVWFDDRVTDIASARRATELVVYTAVFGAGYELPERPPGTADAVCFTDRSDLEPHGWSLCVVRPALPADLARSSREQKIRPHRWLTEHDRSLYVDPSVDLLTDPEELWRALMGEDPGTWFGAFHHSFRDTVADEIDVVIGDGMDAAERVHEHLRALVLTERSSLGSKPVWGGVLARRHQDPRCVSAMEDWHAQVLRYSRRDQISLPGVLDRAGAEGVRLLTADNRGTAWHSWPRPDYRRPDTYTASATDSLVPDILRAEREAARANELAGVVAALQAEVGELRDENSRLRSQVRESDSVRAERDAVLRQRDRMLSSRTWRWTEGPRRAWRAARRG
jgi:hypothetical protein